MSTLQRFTETVLANVCRHLQLPELLHFRLCSKSLLALSSEELMTTMAVLVRDFVPDVENFLDALILHDAVLCGDVALLFMLRDNSFVPKTLDVAVPNDEFVPFVTFLEREHRAHLSSFRTCADNRGIRAIAHLWIGSAELTVLCSTGMDPLAPIPGSVASHLVVYVNPSYFGSPYPSLLFARRALLGHGGSPAAQLACVKEAIVRRFDIRLDVRHWPEYQELRGCGGEKWACASQARHFHDRGALAARIKPLVAKPIRTWVVWRLDSRPCGGRCFEDRNGILGLGELHQTL